MTQSMSNEELDRDLGLPSVIAISMGAMIGSGIFILPGLAMAEAGPSVILAFVIAGILVVPAAVSIAELGTAMPEAGGDYIFIERGMGPGAGTIAGLGTWLMLMFKGALALVGGMLYLGPVFTRFGWQVSEFELQIIAVVVGLILIGVNVIGVKQTGGLQKILVLVMLFILGGFVALSLGNIEGESYTPFLDEGTVGLFGATAMVLISYGGVTKVAAVAEEIKNPGRNLPLGLLGSLLLTTALYALIVFVLVGVVDAETLEGSGTPMVDGVDPFFGFLGVILIVIAAMFALISTANAGILTASRYPFALSRDNLLPDLFASVNERFRTPVTAILTTGGAMLFIIIALPVEEIAKTAGAFQIIVYILVCLALIAFRRRQPAGYDPVFKSPLYPWIQLFGVGSGLFIITQMDTLPIIGAVGIVALGGAWYWVYGRERAERSGLVAEALIETVEATPGEDIPDRIVVPLANPRTQKKLLRTAASVAAARDNAELIVMNVITVPDQTSLAQELAFEKERVDKQRQLLDEAGDVAEELGVKMRTHAIIGRDVADAIEHVVDEENASTVVMGWSGRHTRREHVMGSNIDHIMEQVHCEVMLVKEGADRVGDVLALVGGGPNSEVTLRQAAAVATGERGATLTVANVQDDPDLDEEQAMEQGHAIIQKVADDADVSEFDARVIVADEVESALIELASEYDTTFVGTSRASPLERIISGVIPEHLGEAVEGTVIVVRDADPTRRSLLSAIKSRLSI